VNFYLNYEQYGFLIGLLEEMTANDDRFARVQEILGQMKKALKSRPSRDQWANHVANLIQLDAQDGETLSAELHRIEKTLLKYFPSPAPGE
jgi:hypothetical protein